MDEIKLLAEFVATVYGCGYRQGYGSGRSDALNPNSRKPPKAKRPDIMKEPIDPIPGSDIDAQIAAIHGGNNQ